MVPLLLLPLAAASAPAPRLPIPQIQGDGHRSPWAGKRVRTEGIVTLRSRDGRAFWIQDRGDGDPATSDGIRVGIGRKGPRAPRVGDRVRLEAEVQEWRRGGGLTVTRLRRVRDLEVLARGRPLPPAVPLPELPRVSMPAAVALWESLEGMRVRVPETRAVAATSRHGELALVAHPVADSGFDPVSSHLFPRPLPGGVVDYNPERILVDDIALGRPATVRAGQDLGPFTGVVDYGYGAYVVQAAAVPATTGVPVRPPPPPTRGAGTLRVVSYNLHNLFDTEDDPATADERSTPDRAALERHLDALARHIAGPLGAPEVLVVQEVENDAVLAALAARADGLAGTRYGARTAATADPRGIRTGLLWDRRRLRLQAFESLGADPPGSGRSPFLARLQGTAGTGRLQVIGLHFKSKRGDEPLYTDHWPPSRATEPQRRAQARLVRDVVRAVLAADPEANLVVAGDLNDLPFAEPGEEGRDPLTILRDRGGAGLVPALEGGPAPWRYSYVYRGNAQLLDQILLAPALARRGARPGIAHLNVDRPVAGGRAGRASDHDPVLVDLPWGEGRRHAGERSSGTP